MRSAVTVVAPAAASVWPAPVIGCDTWLPLRAACWWSARAGVCAPRPRWNWPRALLTVGRATLMSQSAASSNCNPGSVASMTRSRGRTTCASNCRPGSVAVNDSLNALDACTSRSSAGSTPVNVSGGLLSKGHPLGATGVANIYEVATHLRGEAGARQIEGAKVGLTHVIGLTSACAVHILEARAQ